MKTRQIKALTYHDRKVCNDIMKDKRNDKRFNNRSYSLFFSMGIFLKHLQLQEFYYASSLTNPFQKQPPEIFCKKNCRNFTGKHLCWSLFSVKFQALEFQDLQNLIIKSSFDFRGYIVFCIITINS